MKFRINVLTPKLKKNKLFHFWFLDVKRLLTYENIAERYVGRTTSHAFYCIGLEWKNVFYFKIFVHTKLLHFPSFFFIDILKKVTRGSIQRLMFLMLIFRLVGGFSPSVFVIHFPSHSCKYKSYLNPSWLLLLDSQRSGGSILYYISLSSLHWTLRVFLHTYRIYYVQIWLLKFVFIDL